LIDFEPETTKWLSGFLFLFILFQLVVMLDRWHRELFFYQLSPKVICASRKSKGNFSPSWREM